MPASLQNILRISLTSRKLSLIPGAQISNCSRIVDFDFKPGALVLIQNTHFEESLNRKTKPRYIGPMVVVHKTIGTSYIIAELDRSQSQLRVASFRLIPYFQQTNTLIPIISNLSEDEDTTEEDPAVVLNKIVYNSWKISYLSNVVSPGLCNAQGITTFLMSCAIHP